MKSFLLKLNLENEYFWKYECINKKWDVILNDYQNKFNHPPKSSNIFIYLSNNPNSIFDDIYQKVNFFGLKLKNIFPYKEPFDNNFYSDFNEHEIVIIIKITKSLKITLILEKI